MGRHVTLCLPFPRYIVRVSPGRRRVTVDYLESQKETVVASLNPSTGRG